MKAGLESVCGWLTASFWTATTPGIDRTWFTLLAGTVSASPPYTVRRCWPTFALGTRFFSSPMNEFSSPAIWSSYRSSAELRDNAFPVTEGLVAANPARPPSYVDVES